MKWAAYFSTTLMLLSILSTPISFAQTTPDFDETGGVAPDSFWYTFDTLWDDTRIAFTFDAESKAQLTAEVSLERLAEMQAMMDSSNYDAVARAAAESQDYLQALQSRINSITDTNPEVIAQIEQAIVYNNAFADSLHEQIQQKVESGEITQDVATDISIDTVQELTVDAGSTFTDHEEELISEYAAEQGIPVIEAEIIYKNAEDTVGLTDVKQTEVTEELTQAVETIETLEDEYYALPEDSEERVPLANMIEDAKLDLQVAETAFKAEDYDESFQQLVEAQDVIFTAEGYLDQSLPPEEIQQVETHWATFDAIQNEVVEENERFATEFAQYKDELAQKYPDKIEALEKLFEHADKVRELATALSDDYSQEFEKLVAEGRSNVEATEILTARFADEYRKAYGEEFVPPGFVVNGEHEYDPTAPEKFGEKKIEASAGGGFVVGTQYTDPVSGYKYEFTETGWRYTTPSGQAYEKTYPDGYVPPKAYEKGNEMYNYKIDTPQGVVEYVYTATGYEVVQPDGKREAFAYSPGQYKLPDGRAVEYKPTGYEIKSGNTVQAKYDYNPEFNTYIATDGSIYKPPEGAYYHNNVNYDTAQKSYNYAYGTDTWTYDPTAGSWKSSTGETYKPEARVVAPVGYESQQSYTSQSGNTWTYDASTGWTSSKGEVYNPTSGQFKSSTGATSTVNYDYRQPEYTFNAQTREYIYETHTETGTGAWIYDPTAGSWTSSTGQTVTGGYIPPTDYPTPAYPSPSITTYQTPTYITPFFTYPTPYYTYPSPSYPYPTPGTYLTPYSYPTPSSYTYPSPYTYPTPGESYSYPTPTTYATPSYSYPTPGTSYATPGYSYPTPGYSYPTPSYPTPSYSYPTPGYAYPSPSSYSYPSPSYAYPTPSYATPYDTPYGTPYGTPDSYSSPYGSPYASPYASPYSTPTGGFVLVDIPNYIRTILENAGFTCVQDSDGLWNCEY